MTLNEIANDAANSNAIRVIAKAVHDMQHAVAAADKTVLEGIAADSSASAAERTLAEIVAGFNHMANDASKARLAAVQ